ncbi:hypothetical protein F2Q69_00057038 [Brassica cretica]|uniref:Uncharacterized protein n=1 Tax=Brassica cretica TaxID=69181 RepID=A0A8S9MT01_BRACR|nr:hypothetical protein F2Q69_00057038 [Brassica cretica]
MLNHFHGALLKLRSFNLGTGLNENREEVTKIECFASHYLNRILLLGSCLVWFSGFCTMSLQALCSYHIFFFQGNLLSRSQYILRCSILRLSRLVPSPLSVDQSGTIDSTRSFLETSLV